MRQQYILDAGSSLHNKYMSDKGDILLDCLDFKM